MPEHQSLKINEVVEKQKRRLEVLLGLAAVFAAYHYVWAFQQALGLEFDYVSFGALLKLPVVAVIVFPLTYWLLVRADPLQRSRMNLPAVKFFKAQFPSVYIRDRCQQCTETSATCNNFIQPQSADASNYWFNEFFRGTFLNEHPEWVSSTLEKGYTCKLVFGIIMLTVAFLVLGFFTLLLGVAPALEITHNEILFFLVCVVVLAITFLMHRHNRSSPEKSTGCWHAWWEINQSHILWLRHHEILLVEKVCHAGQNRREFRAKVQ